MFYKLLEKIHCIYIGGGGISGSFQRPRDVDWKTEFNMDRWLNDDEEELIQKNNVNNV